MTNMNQRDNAALQRLAGELLETLQPARLALEGQAGATPQPAGCAQPLDQAARALRAGELHALALLAEESGALAHTLGDPQSAQRSDALAVLARAVQALPACLEQLAEAQDATPPALLQLLDDLRVLRGEALLAQGSLFTPAAPAAAPALAVELIGARSSDELPALLRRLRQALQLALLGMLRESSQTASLANLERVFARLERLAHEAPQGALWSAAAGVAEGLAQGSLPAGPAIRLLLRQLDRQLRQLCEEGAASINRTPPDALLRGLLFYVAQLPAGSPRGEALKARHALADALPDLAQLDRFAERTPPARGLPLAEEPARFDPQLLEIFGRESETHLATLQAFLQAGTEAPPQPPSAELERALHTLRGSALLAGVLSVAEIAAPLEAMIRDFRARLLAVSEPEAELLRTGEGLLRRAVENLADDPLAPVEGAGAFALDVQVAHRLRLAQAGSAGACRCDAALASAINPLGLIDESWLVDADAGGLPATPAAAAGDGEILPVFADEADDLLDEMQALLRAWQAQPEGPPPAAELLRVLHTLKGAARLAGQAPLADLAHALEQPLADGQPAFESLQAGHLALREALAEVRGRLPAEEAAPGLPQRLLRVPDEALERLSSLAARASSLRERIARLASHNVPLDNLLAEQAQLDEEIEQAALQARRVPVAHLLPRLQRLVAQLAEQLGKPAQLRCEDGVGEVDRGLLAALVAPLEHLLRNAMDHGIESPEQRRAAGKPEVAGLTLELSREGDQLLLALADDGAGIDLAAVRRQALERGLIEADVELDPPAALRLILAPGFSTAAELTQLSGRGIGLDAVNAAVARLGGSLQLESVAGQGARWLIRLPESRSETAAGSQPRVVLVDDSATARQVLARLLERNGFDVEPFADGARALQRLREARPALLILDRQLPPPDGLEIARQARADATLEGLPIMLLSAEETPLEPGQAERVDACLAKPYQDAQLLECIGRLLAQVPA